VVLGMVVRGLMLEDWRIDDEAVEGVAFSDVLMKCLTIDILFIEMDF
jgi:hypothetical protein